MEPAEYEQINAEIAEVVTNMSPGEHTYHLNKMGVKFMDLLDDYNWECTFTSLTTAEVKVFQNALPSRQNIDNKILMWINSWHNFSFANSSASEKECLASETGQMIQYIAAILPDHPVSGRLQRWTMDIYNRETRTFNYDANV